jgi:hypothetical protein
MYGRVVIKDINLEIDQLITACEHILRDPGSINGMQGFGKLGVDVEAEVFLKADELIEGHELGFDLCDAGEIGVDPFHGGFVLVNFGGLAGCGLDALLEFAEDDEGGVHFLDGLDED